MTGDWLRVLFTKWFTALIEALPFIQKFRGQLFVIKYGGSAMEDENVVERFVGFAVYQATGSDGDGLFWRSEGHLLLGPGRSADCAGG